MEAQAVADSLMNGNLIHDHAVRGHAGLMEQVAELVKAKGGELVHESDYYVVKGHAKLMAAVKAKDAADKMAVAAKDAAEKAAHAKVVADAAAAAAKVAPTAAPAGPTPWEARQAALAEAEKKKDAKS